MAAIQLNDVCVSFASYGAGRQSLKRYFLRGLTRSADEGAYRVDALRNINLSVNDGERLALLGRNGAGKSTLLRVLSKVYEPTQGTVSIEGRTASVLSLGLGFFPDSSGHRNIVTSSLFYGADLRHAREQRDAIAAFADLGDALGRPVRTYSAGMQMRLSFAIATAFEPQILLLDEVVGVGDRQFAETARARIDSIASAARIVVLASHNEQALRRHCTRGIVLSSGRIVFDGPIEDAIGYHQTDNG
jgi:ABC-2 type transport system ATP-binding protein/lipopolysaccharide transport system ATP-binding protein